MLPDFDKYDHIIVSYSGGKDSLACVLRLLDLGVSKDKIELWHQCVDGEPGVDPNFMDWEVTEDYCRQTAKALGIKIRFQWKQGGFKREMLRENELTQPISFEDQDGQVVRLAQGRGKESTRRKFPQTSANLSVRWCSAYLKIDVASRAINNDPRFKKAKVLFVSGERREESPARSKYLEFETHRCNSKSRLVDHWRAVIDFKENDVWWLIDRFNINPHPAYHLGLGRLSCKACIFGDKNQWASVREISPDTFRKIADFEIEFACTINRTKSVTELADSGTPYRQTLDNDLVKIATSRRYNPDQIIVDDWKLPAGAFSHCGAPS